MEEKDRELPPLDPLEKSDRWVRFTDVLNQGFHRMDVAIQKIEWISILGLAAACLFAAGMLISLLIEIWRW